MADFDLLARQAEALLESETDALANAANFVALLHDALSDTNWTGIYILRGKELVLGPFQGKPACTRVPLGRGVCGTAAKRNETQRVKDVHAFDGHIACDAASRSELVVPLRARDRVVAVLDIDSPVTDRFSASDQANIEALCSLFERALGESGFEKLAG